MNVFDGKFDVEYDEPVDNDIPVCCNSPRVELVADDIIHQDPMLRHVCMNCGSQRPDLD